MKKVNPALIGGFVVGAIALAIAGVVFLGGGAFFKDAQRLVIYFDGSVNGLTVGSPVKLEGVEVGQVVSIKAIAEIEPLRLSTETIVELDRTRFERHYPKDYDVARDERRVNEDLLAEGLRARLETQSLITGQRYVAFVVEPESPLRLVGLTDVPYLEVPTIPTMSQELEQNVRAAFAKLRDLPIDEIAQNLDATLAAARATFEETSVLARSVNTRVGPLSDSTVAAMDQARDTFASAQETIEPGSPVAYQLSLTLQELSQAARAIRVLADYIEKNPNSLVFGRSQVTP